MPTYATIRSNHFQSDQIEKMAAISSPNLVRASMHMRGELNTHKPLLVATKSQGMSFKFSKKSTEISGHLADHGAFTVEEEAPVRPVSSYEYHNFNSEDYGPLIIDSVVQPISQIKEKKGNFQIPVITL